MRRVITYLALSSIVLMALFQIAVRLMPSIINKLTHGELPLVNIQGIIEKNGIIYIGILPQARIQLYSSEGHYKGYIETHIKPQDFKFWVNDDGTVKVEKTNRYYEQNIFPQPDRSIFYLSEELPIKIAKRNKGITQTIIQQPLILSFFLESGGYHKIHWWCFLVLILINLKIIIRYLPDLAVGKEKSTNLMRAIFLK